LREYVAIYLVVNSVLSQLMTVEVCIECLQTVNSK